MALLRLAAAMRLYESGKLSADGAAELAGIPELEFMRMRGGHRASGIDETPADSEERLGEVCDPRPTADSVAGRSERRR